MHCKNKSLLLCMWLGLFLSGTTATYANDEGTSKTSEAASETVDESDNEDKDKDDGESDNTQEPEESNDDSPDTNEQGENSDLYDDEEQTTEVGEASYNVLDCEELNERLDEEVEDDGKPVQKDLDECKKVVK